MEEDRLIDSAEDNEEAQFHNSLRPNQMEEYVGQEKIKENLNIFIAAAKMREESLDHVLFYGCLLYTSPSPRDRTRSRMPSSA